MRGIKTCLGILWLLLPLYLFMHSEDKDELLRLKAVREKEHERSQQAKVDEAERRAPSKRAAKGSTLQKELDELFGLVIP